MAWEPFARDVTTPNGDQWHISIRWLPRRRPRWREPDGMEWNDDASAELFEASCESCGMALVLLVIVCFVLVM